MKLEVGMYVRTDNGIIGKIYEKIGGMFTYKDSNRDYITYGLLHTEIKKTSHNIIDLIEVGDYVNGEKVIRIDKDPFIKGQINLWTNIRNTNGFGDIEIMKIIDKDIKSILTKEQFESMSYKVGE